MALEDAGGDVERQGQAWDLETNWTDDTTAPIRPQQIYKPHWINRLWPFASEDRLDLFPSHL